MIFGLHDWSISVLERMRIRVQGDLLAGRKWQYGSPVCTFDLYQRCGGTDYLLEMAARVEDQLNEMMQRPMFREFKVRYFQQHVPSRTR